MTWESRDRKLKAKRARMPKHGATLAQTYATVVRNREALRALVQGGTRKEPKICSGK
jgi:hypothetical protein